MKDQLAFTYYRNHVEGEDSRISHYIPICQRTISMCRERTSEMKTAQHLNINLTP